MPTDILERNSKMTDYVIYADSSLDLSKETAKEWGVPYAQLTFRFDNGDEYSNDDMPISEFYAKMRAGGVAKTAAVNTDSFYNAFDSVLAEGKDLIYVGFSSGLSSTYSAAMLAARNLCAKYPDRKIYTVDTLAASAGIALLISYMLDMKAEGKSIDEVRDFAEKMKLNVCHWFTVDNLDYLKRGGRVSPTVAFVGNLLGIKPVLHVDNEGHLTNVDKVRGRRTSLMALADRLGATILDGYDKVFISHSDCLDDAKLLASMIEAKYHKTVGLITNVGPVIGAHSGPGTMALFFMGKER